MQFDPAEKAILRKTFDDLRALTPGVSTAFYETLFDLDPGLRRLFRDDLEGQGMRFMTALGLIVGRLDDPRALDERLALLGRSHAVFGLTGQDYRTMSEAFFITMQHALGAAMTPEAQRAWRKVFARISAAMLAAGGEGGAQASAAAASGPGLVPRSR